MTIAMVNRPFIPNQPALSFCMIASRTDQQGLALIFAMVKDGIEVGLACPTADYVQSRAFTTERMGTAISKEGESESAIRAWLLWQTDLAHQFGKPRIRTQRVELEVSVQTDQQPVVFLVSDIEPMESLIFVSQVSVEAGNLQR